MPQSLFGSLPNILQWLGFVVDLSKGQIEVPEDKLAAVKVKLQKSYQLRLVSAKHLASSGMPVWQIIIVSLFGIPPLQ